MRPPYTSTMAGETASPTSALLGVEGDHHPLDVVGHRGELIAAVRRQAYRSTTGADGLEPAAQLLDVGDRSSANGAPAHGVNR